MIGLQILKRQRAVSLALADKFKAIPVANVSDCMARMSAGGARIKPWHDGTPMAGPALTVKARPGDNLMVHKALELAVLGDVIVVDAGGDLTNAIVGEIMMGIAVRRGLGGFVVNGALRDAAAIRKGSVPVFAAGVTHRGPYKDGPGEINVPIAIDGMVIHPGDLVIGDEDGFLCVPFDEAEALLVAAENKGRLETKMIEQMTNGTYDSTWVDATLKRLGCAIEE